MTSMTLTKNQKTIKMTEDDIQAFIDGDRDAFHRIYQQTYNFVFNLIYHMVGNCRAEAEDLTHDIYLKIYNIRHKIDKKSSFEGWIKRVAVNYTINSQKRYWKWLNKLSQVYWHLINHNHDNAYENKIEKQEEFGKVKELLDTLLPDDRVVLILKEILNFTHKQISEMLGIKLNTVQVRLHRAKQRLSDAYKNSMKGGF